MTARRRNVSRLLSGKNNEETPSNRRFNRPGKVDVESDIPTEILEKILSQLSLYDNILASCVCRRWHAVATSVRKANRNPLLMYFSRESDIWEFYDPAKRISYTLKLPGLQNYHMCYSKDGWLLLIELRTFRYFLCCPYTRESMYLPDNALKCERAAFSAPPTSPGCVVFAITEVRPNSVAVRTFRPGDAAWTTAHYHCSEPFQVRLPGQAVYCDGFFYCLSKSGYLGFFNPENGIWGVLPVPRSIGDKVFPTGICGQFIYMAEYNGDLYIMYSRAFSEPLVLKLDKANHQWELIEDLGGLTFFCNFRMSVICTDMVGIIRNSIYFPKVLYQGRRCIVYSFNQARFLPRKEGYKLGELESYQNIWIDPPKDLSIFN